MNSETFSKKFEKTTEVLPFTKYGLSSIQEFKEAKKDIRELEWLKKAGLTQEEITLFKEYEVGLLNKQNKIESNVMKEKLDVIYSKVTKLRNETEQSNISSCKNGQAANPSNTSESTPHAIQMKPLAFYPNGHPMNNIKEIEQNLFGHLKNDMIPINKRRKILRRLERKKNRILATNDIICINTVANTSKVDRLGSLWDVKEMPPKQRNTNYNQKSTDTKPTIGPKKPTMYTIKDNKIVRLEPVSNERQEYKAVDIVIPVNDTEMQLLESTKLCVDDIKKLDRFKDYNPGIPSKILYLKNIAPSITQEQLSLLFKQFTQANGGPVDVRLLSGRMRGQAFVYFLSEDIATQALDRTNGTILSGRPLIAQFGRNTDKIDNTMHS